MNIRILPEAERDLEIGADFYEAQREELGRCSNDCLMSDIESLWVDVSFPLASRFLKGLVISAPEHHCEVEDLGTFSVKSAHLH